ncbi:hypothetical protein [Amycolatopsis sp. MEPSY49]|uniref:hypothetical protein n=1 Tax=Amycolatopsis sp. MEPSY49 TaxID=3151600 RepID=UPI003EF73239
MAKHIDNGRRGKIRRVAAGIALILTVAGVIAPALSGQEPATTVVIAGGGGGGNTGN